MQSLKIAATPFSDRPIRLVTKPAETQVKPCGSQPATELWGSCHPPAGLLIFQFALPHDFRTPCLGECGQVYLARGNCGRLPIQGIDHAVANKNVVGVVFAVNDRWRRREKNIDAFLKAFGESREQRKVLVQATGE